VSLIYQFILAIVSIAWLNSKYIRGMELGAIIPVMGVIIVLIGIIVGDISWMVQTNNINIMDIFKVN
jgi:hypothetical protein